MIATKLPKEPECDEVRGWYDFEGLEAAECLQESQAVINFATFHNRDFMEVELEEVGGSSSGIEGWARAQLVEWKTLGPDSSVHILPGFPRQESDVDSPHVTDEGRWPRTINNQDAVRPLGKPKITVTTEKTSAVEDAVQILEAKEAAMAELCLEHLPEVQRKEKELVRRVQQEAQGKSVPGVVRAQDAWKNLLSDAQDRKRHVEELEKEDRKVRGLAWLLPESKDPLLCTSYKSEQDGWVCVECVLDSGAAECVAPMGMIAHIKVEDSPGSVAGLHYTVANGGRIPNRGQQRIPVQLGNGDRTSATFQLADVQRLLMSVAKVCAAGNRVMFGQLGGCILNLASGRTTILP